MPPVYTYDDEGNRVTLKVGSNHVECQPTDDEGFTRCGPVSQRARRDLQAKLSAQGMEGDELQMALQRAEDAGDIPPRQFGALSYRRFDTSDRHSVSVRGVAPQRHCGTTGYAYRLSARQFACWRGHSLDDAVRHFGCASDDSC